MNLDNDEFFLTFSLPHFVMRHGRIIQENGNHLQIVKAYSRTRWRRFWTWVGFDMGLVSTGIKYKVKLIK
jgi:hypothetical protein